MVWMFRGAVKSLSLPGIKLQFLSHQVYSPVTADHTFHFFELNPKFGIASTRVYHWIWSWSSFMHFLHNILWRRNVPVSSLLQMSFSPKYYVNLLPLLWPVHCHVYFTVILVTCINHLLQCKCRWILTLSYFVLYHLV